MFYNESRYIDILNISYYRLARLKKNISERLRRDSKSSSSASEEADDIIAKDSPTEKNASRSGVSTVRRESGASVHSTASRRRSSVASQVGKMLLNQL